MEPKVLISESYTYLNVFCGSVIETFWIRCQYVPPVTYGIHPFVVPQIGKKNPAFSVRLVSESLDKLEYWDGVISPKGGSQETSNMTQNPWTHRSVNRTR
jgi:hypothetical protein